MELNCSKHCSLEFLTTSYRYHTKPSSLSWYSLTTGTMTSQYLLHKTWFACTEPKEPSRKFSQGMPPAAAGSSFTKKKCGGGALQNTWDHLVWTKTGRVRIQSQATTTLLFSINLTYQINTKIDVMNTPALTQNNKWCLDQYFSGNIQ